MGTSTFERLSDRAQPEYALGVAQLEAWHEICRERRLGMPEARRKYESRANRTVFDWHDNSHNRRPRKRGGAR